MFLFHSIAPSVVKWRNSQWQAENVDQKEEEEGVIDLAKVIDR